MALLNEFNFEIVHAHDWPSALVMPLLSIRGRNLKKVFTIHNAAYQGRFSGDKFELSGLPKSFFNWEQMEYYNDINLLKGGITFANLVTAVSPQYAGSYVSGLGANISARLKLPPTVEPGSNLAAMRLTRTNSELVVPQIVAP